MSFSHPEQLFGYSVPDIQGKEVRAADALIAVVMEATDAVDCFGYRHIDWVVYMTNPGSGPITRVDMQIQFSEKLDPSPILDSDWAILQSHEINQGIAPLYNYTMQMPIPSLGPGPDFIPFTFGITSPVRGRWMRLLITAGAGDPTNSLVSVNAIRR